MFAQTKSIPCPTYPHITSHGKLTPRKPSLGSKDATIVELFCMDLLSLDDGVTEWNAMKSFLIRDDIPYIWTSGRKCNFKGCDHFSLQPPITNGWFWASNKIRIPNPFASKCQHCVWSKTGPQPDNREGITAGRDEACLAVLNNVYNDGITWHDVACHHKKPVICESRRFVLKF
ncbi:unnamed protein product [Lepeophtheirus salmonis]|uniref:(salmon louse) hypothetical protein n=1 Tax=Lepeophtheirus salmonis TaxID=72036 RepID=A0A7R8HCW1_LEPSM|nr:unnamed protein product [Lepeophtheirus salmonis]CAF3018505.1 unnamed protein product [Lepeophtheirus salmonis]